MYERLNMSTDNALAYRINQPLSKIEIQEIRLDLEGTIAAKGKIRVLIDLHAFPYVDLESFWEDLKFEVKYVRELERFALVGGGEIEKWATRAFGALTFTRCRCFAETQLEEAWSWLTED